MKQVFVLVFAMALFAATAPAQNKNNELGFLLGAEFIPGKSAATGSSLDFTRGIIFSANYARRISSGQTALFLEFPFAATPSHRVQTTQSGVITDIATLYVTPSLRANFVHDSNVSPWISAGFGYGLYEGSQLLNNAATNPQRHVSTGTLQFGAGVDVRTGIEILVPISLRGEVRDFYTLKSPFFATPVDGGQHNIVAAGGFVIHF